LSHMENDKFPSVSTRDWEDRIKEDLRGADYEKKLVWKTHDGYRIRPYYRREDLGGIDYLDSMPGQYPYLRGSAAEGNDWLVRQDICVAGTGQGAGTERGAEAANREALDAIKRGATSIGFDLSDSGLPGDEFIPALLRDLPIERVPVNFILDGDFISLLQELHDYAVKNNMDPANIRGSISLDPLGSFASTGRFRKDMQADLGGVQECLGFVHESLPGFRVINIGGNIIHDAGASISQALAFSLAMGNEYLVRLGDMGLPPGSILPHMQFRFSVGSSYFMEIAKLRAARHLWSGILQAWSDAPQELPPMFMDCITSEWNQTLYDPHVNMLRGTTAAMSAIMGGTDSLTVSPFDLPLDGPGGFSARVSRNTQIILKEESHLDKVADPAAGSYYIENLTDTLITGAWKIFLLTEKKGGFHKCLTEGSIQEEINKTASTRTGNLAGRREMLLGTNQFPLMDEKAGIRPEDHGASASVSGQDPAGAAPGGPEAKPLRKFRGSTDFEQLRLRTENHPGGQPVVFIIPLGNLAMRRARAMFSMNFFGCAGFKVLDNIGKFRTVGEGLKAAGEAGADIVVLCSSDDEYPAMAEDFASAAARKVPGKTKGMIPVIAGYPKEHVDTLKKSGLEHFIHLRSNVLEELGKYQELLGI
jgi:methylmalonyl-CoA mutase